uniref:SBP-type domain-containing protein n=2 Tax=Tetraselmis sp. GSL018 TaxID=582737 RepID=A0A061QM55_9CHLO
MLSCLCPEYQTLFCNLALSPASDIDDHCRRTFHIRNQFLNQSGLKDFTLKNENKPFGTFCWSRLPTLSNNFYYWQRNPRMLPLDACPATSARTLWNCYRESNATHEEAIKLCKETDTTGCADNGHSRKTPQSEKYFDAVEQYAHRLEGPSKHGGVQNERHRLPDLCRSKLTSSVENLKQTSCSEYQWLQPSTAYPFQIRDPYYGLKNYPETHYNREIESTDKRICFQSTEDHELMHDNVEYPLPTVSCPVSTDTNHLRCQVCKKLVQVSNIKKYLRCRKICNSCRFAKKCFKNGVEVRFCQLCSWVHPLHCFDGEKRSCRSELQKHNLRRRRKKLSIES